MLRPATHLAAVIGLLSWSPGQHAAMAGDRFIGRAAIASDYVLRGVSQTEEDPALQVGVSYTLDSGFFAGLWASNVSFSVAHGTIDTGIDAELDAFVGFSRPFGEEWLGSATLGRYLYHGDHELVDFDYTELTLSAQYEDWLALSLAYSPDTVAYAAGRLARDRPSLSYEVSGRYALNERLQLDAGLGYRDLGRLFGRGYAYWHFGATAPFERCALELSYFGTDNRAADLFGEALAGDRLVLSLSVSF